MTRSFYDPNAEQLTRLDVPFICAYSGGKDSTSLVTWIEWLRRAGWISCPRPRLVISDTEVEYPFLRRVAKDLQELLQKTGWLCEEVRPRRKDKLYCAIFGRGVPPVLPMAKRMRWCTRATKVDPMKRFKNTLGDVLTLTGLRWGESKMRDEKMLKGGCVAGGECGIPNPGNDTYSPIVNWTDCQVMDWLNGHVAVRKSMPEVFEVTRTLLDVYNVKKQTIKTLFGEQTKVTMLRFGCIGCPAVGKDKPARFFEAINPEYRHLRRLYVLWEQCRDRRNRINRQNEETKVGFGFTPRRIHGPIKMEARKKLFEVLLDIQKKSGVTLVSRSDIRFIRKCWTDDVYPRGWSKEDE